MNIRQHDKQPHLFTLELKGVVFTMSKKEIESLELYITMILKNYKKITKKDLDE